MESRRLGRLLKRALVTAAEAMRALGSPADGGSAAVPDAIITGTGLGCIENTELLLKQMCCEGDDTLKPTNFMQSTHNTIGSLIAINTRCHGYNSTYSHKAVSFDTALLDAFMQLRLGDIGTALVTGNDEMTPSYFTILRRAGYLGQPGQCPASEASVAMLLSTEAGDALCQLSDVQLVCSSAPLTSHPTPLTPHPSPLTPHPSPLTPHPSPLTPHVDAILVGINGSAANDRFYSNLIPSLPAAPLLHYKHLFGECYSSSALGLYAAAHIIANGEAPACMRCDGLHQPLPVSRILVVNHSAGTCFSYVTLCKS